MSILKKAMIALLLVVVMLFGAFSTIIVAAETSASLSYIIVDEYTIDSKKYSVAELTKDYEGVKSGEFFFLDSNGKVVTDPQVYSKLLKINIVYSSASVFKKGLESYIDAMQAYYDVYKAIQLSETVGTIVAKGTYLSLNVLANEPFSILDASLDIVSEVINP